MGYEVTYNFRESISPGVYSEEIQSKSVKVGSASEDTPLEVLAGKVMAQLARRNILIVDVEIFEYTRKKLTYKEAEDGIIIKNKKFRFDDGPISVGETTAADESPENALAALLAANPNLLQELRQHAAPQQALHVHSAPSRQQQAPPMPSRPTSIVQTSSGPMRARRWEIFSPELMLEHKAKQQGLKLTMNKKYPIFEEEQVGLPPLTRTRYKTQDDQGKLITADAEYFVPAVSGRLSHEDEMMSSHPTNSDIDLWGGQRGEEEFNIPDIRRR